MNRYGLNFYRSKIIDLINDCVHSGEFDYEEFSNKISGLSSAALVEGVSPVEFKGLVDELINEMQYGEFKKIS